jgi:hypothetical protein
VSGKAKCSSSAIYTRPLYNVVYVTKDWRRRFHVKPSGGHVFVAAILAIASCVTPWYLGIPLFTLAALIFFRRAQFR